MLVNVFDFEEEAPSQRPIKRISGKTAEDMFSGELFERVLVEYRDGGVPALKVPVSKFIDDLAENGKVIGPYRVDSVCLRRSHSSLTPEESLRKGIEGLINEAKRKQAVAIAKCEFSLDKTNSKDNLLEFYGQVVIPLYSGKKNVSSGFCR